MMIIKIVTIIYIFIVANGIFKELRGPQTSFSLFFSEFDSQIFAKMLFWPYNKITELQSCMYYIPKICWKLRSNVLYKWAKALFDCTSSRHFKAKSLFKSRFLKKCWSLQEGLIVPLKAKFTIMQPVIIGYLFNFILYFSRGLLH